jgi:hypothetical protein
MQKDVHYYLTYALALKAGFSRSDAKIVAWADQFTDELTSPDIYEIQTQCGTVDDWYDVKSQLTVLIPFHFMPGEDPEWPWMTTENCSRARYTVNLAIKNNDLVQLGIALHVLQDTFSHQGFSGWQESNNSCYNWYNLSSMAPNVGHAEMRHVPDDAGHQWTDPRTNKRINNPSRVKRAAKATLQYLCEYNNNSQTNLILKQISPLLDNALKEKDYDKRKFLFNAISGVNAPRYKRVTNNMIQHYKSRFIAAARCHLSAALESMEGIEWNEE